jgi:large subunit ribosomal protein L21
MFAIVELNGEQYKVDSTTDKLRVQYLDGVTVGTPVSFDKVLLTENGGKVTVGGSAKITASVAAHDRDETIIVFKKKRRKDYRRTNGHRQKFTVLNVSIA